MSEAPERICIDPTSEDENGVFLAARPGHSVNIDVGYVSDDRIEELEAKLANAIEFAEIVEQCAHGALWDLARAALAELKGAEDADRT